MKNVDSRPPNIFSPRNPIQALNQDVQFDLVKNMISNTVTSVQHKNLVNFNGIQTNSKGNNIFKPTLIYCNRGLLPTEFCNFIFFVSVVYSIIFLTVILVGTRFYEYPITIIYKHDKPLVIIMDCFFFDGSIIGLLSNALACNFLEYSIRLIYYLR